MTGLPIEDLIRRNDITLNLRNPEFLCNLHETVIESTLKPPSSLPTSRKRKPFTSLLTLLVVEHQTFVRVCVVLSYSLSEDSENSNKRLRVRRTDLGGPLTLLDDKTSFFLDGPTETVDD